MPDYGTKPILISVAGGVFIYSGFKGLTISQTIRDLVSGKNPAKDAAQIGGDGGTGGVPGSFDERKSRTVNVGAAQAGREYPPAQARAMAKQMAESYGWSSGQQWSALVTLWNNESGWRNTAYNKASGATGIPQAVPPTKLPAAGQAPTFDPAAQIGWGLSYIKERYGNPVSALRFWMRTDPRPYPGHWY